MTDPMMLGERFLVLGRRVRSRQGELLHALDLHPGQDAFLMELWREPGLTQSMLAERLGIESPTVTRMSSRLERVGMVERRRDPDDARATRLYPTARSRLLEASVRRVWEELATELVSDISAEEVDVLNALLEKLTEASPD